MKNLKLQEYNAVQSLIEMYGKEIDKIEKEISIIDNKYKKLAEEEKKSQKIKLEELKSAKKKWDKLFSGMEIPKENAQPETNEKAEPEIIAEVSQDYNTEGPKLFTAPQAASTEAQQPENPQFEGVFSEMADVDSVIDKEKTPDGWPDIPEEWKTEK